MTEAQLQTQFSSRKDDWETPQELFDQYNERFNFNLDAASNDNNAKCQNHFTVSDDGLSQNWGGVQSVVESPVWQRDRTVGS